METLELFDIFRLMSMRLTLWTVPYIKELLQFIVLRYAIFSQ